MLGAFKIKQEYISDNCLDGTCELIEEFIIAERELYANKKIQADLAETVLSNIREIIEPEEKMKLLSLLKSELMEYDREQVEQREYFIDRIKYEVERLEHEIKELVGIDPNTQATQLEQMIRDISEAGGNRVDALRSLSKRYEIDEDDPEMQAELIKFISGVERASRLYESLTKISEIADQVRTTEERIEYLIKKSRKPAVPETQSVNSHDLKPSPPNKTGIRKRYHWLKTLNIIIHKFFKKTSIKKT